MKGFFIIILTISILLSYGCRDTKNDNARLVNSKLEKYVPKNNNVRYLLDTTMQSSSHHILENWAEDVLYELREPVLRQNIDSLEFVRLVWLPTFGNPIVVRVNNFDGNTFGNIKEISQTASRNKSRPSVLLDTVISLSLGQWKSITEPMMSSLFWASSYKDTTESEQDGTSWFLECRLSNNYKIVERWDDGYLSAEETRKYLTPLIAFVNKYTSLKSKR